MKKDKKYIMHTFHFLIGLFILIFVGISGFSRINFADERVGTGEIIIHTEKTEMDVANFALIQLSVNTSYSDSEKESLANSVKFQGEGDFQSFIEQKNFIRATKTENGIFLFSKLTSGTYYLIGLDKSDNPTILKDYHDSIISLLQNQILDVYPKQVDYPSPEYTHLSVEKKWLGPKLSEVKIYLKCNGKIVDQVILSEKNKWCHEFINLPTQYQNQKANYQVEEALLNNYQVDYQRVSKNRIIVTNTFIPPKKKIFQTGNMLIFGLLGCGLIIFGIGYQWMKKE
ncbi:Cna B-type domain-containing protein [Enterococcus cecorum]